MNANEAVGRYREIMPRLPVARFPERSVAAADLSALAHHFDAFVLDGFGVLNVGPDPVPGARERLQALQAQGKLLRVLTNGASFPSSLTTAKYHRWDMPFQAEEVVSSRDALEVRLRQEACDRLWGFVALEASMLDQLTPRAEDDANVNEPPPSRVMHNG